MEKPNYIETKKEESFERTTNAIEHSEAVEFVERNKDFFEHYAKGQVKVLPAPEGVKTFAFNLENNEIYVNSMFYKKLGFSDDKTLFATCHEIEHFLEKVQILDEEGGEKKFEKYLKKIKASKAFSLIDNCNADIRENRGVIQRTNEGMRELEQNIYQNDLFVETDFTKVPRHIQFSQALLREARVMGELCTVAPEVRKALDEVAGVKGLMDIMTNPQTTMSMRLRLQDRYLWPKVSELLEKDMEDKKKEQAQKAQKSENGEGQDGEKSESNEVNEGDPNEMFADDYAEANKKFPEAMPIEEVEKALKEWQEVQKSKDSADRADKDYAQKIGVGKLDLQSYRQTVEDLEKITNPETNLSVQEELKNLFNRIIAKRAKMKLVPRYPQEEGDELVDPAQLIAEVKSGNIQPKVWEDTEFKEVKGDWFGEVEITLVCDRSGSMAGVKAEEQIKSAVLVMEVLKEFAEMCESEKMNISKPLEVKSEIYSFASSVEDKTPIKKMSAELGEAERIKIFKILHSVPGGTTDFNCLEAINNNLDESAKNKIKIGELKKIVIIFTDGVSDDGAKVQKELKRMRDAGVVAVGVGITKEGETVLNTYAPHAMVVEEVKKLPNVLGELLKEHLKDL